MNINRVKNTVDICSLHPILTFLLTPLPGPPPRTQTPESTLIASVLTRPSGLAGILLAAPAPVLPSPAVGLPLAAGAVSPTVTLAAAAAVAPAVGYALTAVGAGRGGEGAADVVAADAAPLAVAVVGAGVALPQADAAGGERFRG